MMTAFVAILCVSAFAATAALILPLVGRDRINTDVQVARVSRLAAVAFAGASPIAAAAVYLWLGAPELIAGERRPPRAAVLSPDERGAMIAAMVSGLASRLEANPEDAEGWRMLARSYAVLGDHEESARAWRELLTRVEGLAEDWRGYCAALLALGPGGDRKVEIDAAMRRLIAIDENDPLALYYLGEAARAEGDPATAVAHWTRLLANLPADAPVRPAIERMVAEARNAAGPRE